MKNWSLFILNLNVVISTCQWEDQERKEFMNVQIVDNVREPLRMGKVSMGYLPDRGLEKSM